MRGRIFFMRKNKLITASILSLTMMLGTPATAIFAAANDAVPASQQLQITRGEFLHLLVSTLDLPDVQYIPIFKDLSKSNPLYSDVSKLAGKGMLSGYADHTLRLQQPIQKVEALALIGKALGMPQEPVPGVTSGLAKSHWAYTLSTWFEAAQLKIDWTTASKPLTKQDAAALLQGILTTKPEALQKVEAMQKAQQQVKSFRFTGTNQMHMVPSEKDAKDTPLAMTQKLEAEFMLPNSIHMKSVAQLSGPMGKEFTTEQYIIGKDMYMKMPDLGGAADPSAPKGWLKMENALPFDMGEMFKQQVQGIPPQLAKKLFYREVGPHQLAFQGRIDGLSDLMGLMGNLPNAEGMKKTLENAPDQLGSLYMQGVISLNPATQLPNEVSYQMVMQFKGNGNNPSPIKSMTMSQDVKYSDFNSDLKIVLPDEAKNAKTMTLPTAP
jgi:hypothetical protein